MSRLDYIEGTIRELEGNIALAITKLEGDVGSIALIHRLAGDIGSLKNQVELLRRDEARNPSDPGRPDTCDCIPEPVRSVRVTGWRHDETCPAAGNPSDPSEAYLAGRALANEHIARIERVVAEHSDPGPAQRTEP